MDGLEIKDKDAARQKSPLHTAEHCLQVLLLQEVIDAVSGAHHGTGRAVEFEIPHVLKGIESAAPGLDFPLLCDRQHVLGEVDADHVAAPRSQKLRQLPCSAAQIYDNISLLCKVFPGCLRLCCNVCFNTCFTLCFKIGSTCFPGCLRSCFNVCFSRESVELQQSAEAVRPHPIGFLIHEGIIDIGKVCIAFQ